MVLILDYDYSKGGDKVGLIEKSKGNGKYSKYRGESENE